jgi:hypothetical protein
MAEKRIPLELPVEGPAWFQDEPGKQTNMTRKANNWMVVGGTLSLVGALLVGSTGCQSSIGGQTLPSPYYLLDDVQYYPSGPEFKLPREASALQAAQAEEAARKATQR